MNASTNTPREFGLVQFKARLLQYGAVLADMAKAGTVCELGFGVIGEKDHAAVKVKSFFKCADHFFDDLVYRRLDTDSVPNLAGEHGVVIIGIQLIYELISGGG